MRCLMQNSCNPSPDLRMGVSVNINIERYQKVHIGIASPVSVQNLERYLNVNEGTLPDCVSGTNVTVIINSLLQAGNTVSIYTLSKHVKSITYFKFDHCTIHIGNYRNNHRAWDLFKKEIDAVNYMINCDPAQVIHSNWSYEFALGSLKSGKPTLVTLRDWAPVILRYMPDHYRFARLLLNNKVMRKAQRFTVNSPYLQKLAEKKLGHEVALIPNPVDEKMFVEGKKNYKENYLFKIMSVNNGFTKRKNVNCLLKAFSTVSKKFKNAKLLLIGEGYEPGGEAQTWAVKNGICIEAVIFCGPIYASRLIQLYDQADLLVHPSLEESFGNTLVEAMARKVPVIGGVKSGAVPWVLDYGKAGVLVDVTDTQAMAESIINVLSDKPIWYSFSEKGYDNAYKRFRVSEIIKLYLEEYQKTIALHDLRNKNSGKYHDAISK